MSDWVSLSARVPQLISWYQHAARALPWRQGDPDPYRVWISEIMSQQSTLVTVVPYFLRWMTRFPNLESLAEAQDEDVLSLWAGLGYYSRARNLLAAAQKLADHRRIHGDWPHTWDEWKALPGVGAYTASAVTSIALNGPYLAFDGNVCRVLARYLGVWDPLNKTSERRFLEESLTALAQQLARDTQGVHGVLTQALMELGALVCRPGAQANCALCPLAIDCRAHAEGRVETTPRSKERPTIIVQPQLALIYRGRRRDHLLLRKIPAGRRLEGQWELPLLNIDSDQESWDHAALGRHFEIHPKKIRHSVTRYRYEVQVVEAGFWEEPIPESHVFWTQGTPPPGTLTTLTRKILLI